MKLRRLLSVPIVLLALVVAAIGVRFIFLEREIKGALGDDLQGPLQVARVEIEAWRDRLALRARVAADLIASGAAFDGVARGVTSSDSATLWIATTAGAVTRKSGPLASSISSVGQRMQREFITTRCSAGYCTDAGMPVVLPSGDSLVVGIRVPLSDGTFRHLDSPRHIQSSRASLLTRQGDSLVVLASAAHDTIPLTQRAFSWSTAPEHIHRAFTTTRTAGVALQGLVHEKVLFGTERDTLMNWVLVREIEGYALFEQFLTRVLIDVLFVGALVLFALAYVRSRLRIAGMRRDQELASLRANFVSAVSHELRTPLAQITLFADLLRNGSLRGPAENERALNVIEKEAGRLAILVDNVLNHARLTRADKTKDPAGALHATDVARDVAYVIDAFGPLAAEKDVRVISTVPEGLTAAVDSQSLRQILLNFLENAVKYGPPGQTVTLESVETADAIRIGVSDEGPGVPAAERETIWRAFERGAAGHVSREGGSGIGLSVVRDLAEQFGGRAWVEATPTNGAHFVVEFARAAESEVRRFASQHAAPAG